MSANTTPLIPSTFCPGKWEELCFNLNYNYVYGCCAATPIKFFKNFNEVLDQQKNNLLNGVQDSSCNYCWSVEKGGQPSRRNEYTSKFDGNLEPYTSNAVPVKLLELNLGNECNFQCVYCNPKYSSVWEADIRKQPYKIFTDRFNYGVLDKEEVSLPDANAQVLQQIGHTEEVRIIGGEPLLNKHLWSLLDKVSTDRLHITTNLSCGVETINRLLSMAQSKFKQIRFQISLDSTGKIAEFARYGTNYADVVANVEHTLHTAPDNVLVSIASTFTSITIRDIQNFRKQVENWQTIRPNLVWTLNYCRNPNTQSFYTLPNEYREDILKVVQHIKTMPNIERAEIIESALSNYKFNLTMHKEMKHFMQQFATRKNIEIPLCLD